jgi:Nucleotide-sugar transporter
MTRSPGSVPRRFGLDEISLMSKNASGRHTFARGRTAAALLDSSLAASILQLHQANNAETMMKEGDQHEMELLLQSGEAPDHGGVEDQLIPEKSGAPSDSGGPKMRTRKAGLKPRDPTKKRAKRREAENVSAVLIKYGALILLVGQMVGLVLLMRHSRTNQPKDQPQYLASTAVLVNELIKLVICCCVISYQSGGNLLSEMKTHVLESPAEMAKLSVPAFLYTVQNNLLYLALTNLDAATYQVCYQLKILTTAVFSMVMLQVSCFFNRQARALAFSVANVATNGH